MDPIGKEYSLAQVLLVIAGVPIVGGLHDDAVTIEPAADLYEVVTGPDGHTVFNRVNNNDWLMTISLMETSRAVPLIDGVLQASLITIPGAPKLLPVSMRDNLSGESITAGSAVFIRRPNMSKGATAGARAFALHLVSPMVSTATLNLTR